MGRGIAIKIPLIVVGVSIFVFIVVNRDYLPFFRFDQYDRSFNPVRLRLGQPIIEDYFIRKFEKAATRQIWFAPDSLKFRRLHTGKFYGTEHGEITFESDSYRKWMDSSRWSRLTREYYYKKDSVGYYIERFDGKEKVSERKLTKASGDSILSAWKREFRE